MTTVGRRITATLALALAGLLCAAAVRAADTAGNDAAERTRIASERRAVEDRFDAARLDCERRFMVTDCLADARAQRREALAPLQQQLHLLDDARRQQRAVDRLRMIQAREAAAAARPALETAAAPSASASTASTAPTPPARLAVRPAAPASSSAPHQAPHRAARHAQRLQQARAHEEAVKSRHARRDAQRPPAAGLPVPVPPASTP